MPSFSRPFACLPFRGASASILGPGLVALLAMNGAACAAGPDRPAAAPASEARRPLPLKRVRLYDSGVGYFERSGELREGDPASLPVPAAHVDDALKSMVILSAGGAAKVTAVEFASVLSRGLARSQAGLELSAKRPLQYQKVLASLRGTDLRVELEGGDTVVGRLLEVTKVPAPKPPPEAKGEDLERWTRALGDAEKQYHLVVMGRAGDLRRLKTTEIRALTPTDPAVARRLDAAAAALGDRAAQATRQLQVAGSGGAVRLGYVAETPVWRSSYRLVLPPSPGAAAGKPVRATLQGWALIHNDTDEPWEGVRVELVNGRPTSFLFPLTAPRYARRTLAHPERELSTVPQLSRRTPDQIWGDHVKTDEGGTIGYGSGTGSGSGFGAGYGRAAERGIRVRSKAVTRESNAITVGNLAAVDGAKAKAEGALFSYELPKPIRLRSHGSALVPFAQVTVAARRASFFASDSATPKSVVDLKHRGRQTLPTGPFALFSPTGFIGESVLPRLEPGARRILEFGIDLDVDLERQSRGEAKTKRTYRFVRLRGKRVELHYVQHSERRYRLHNRSQQPRSVYLSLPIGTNAKVTGAERVDYDQERGRPFVVFDLKAGAEVDRALDIERGLSESVNVGSVEPKTVERWLKVASALPAPQLKVLELVKTEVTQLDQLREARKEARKERRRRKNDLSRARKNLKALGKDAGAAARPLVARVVEQERALSASEGAERRADAALKDGLKKAAIKVQAAFEALEEKE